MEIYDTKYLKYDEYPDANIFVKFTSSKNPELNFEGIAKICSNNGLCCIAVTPKYRMFTLYYDDCNGKLGIASDDEKGETVEFYKISSKKRPVFNSGFLDITQ